MISGWQHALHLFERPVELRAGQKVTLSASHNRLTLDIALADSR